MRNIKKYRKNFLNLKFERHLEKFRRISISQVVAKFKFKNILEIGCGVSPIGDSLNLEWVEYYIVEIDKKFAEEAKKNI